MDTIIHDTTERKQAEAEREHLLAEIQVRFEVSQALSGARIEKEVLDALIQQAGIYPEAQVVFSLYDPEAEEPTLVAKRAAAFESGLAPVTIGSRFPASQFTILDLFSPDEPFVVSNLPTDERIDPATRQYFTELGNASILIIIMMTGDERIGILRAGSPKEGYFDEHKQHLYRALADQGATALRAARLYDEIQRREERFQGMANTTQDGWTIIEHDEVVYVNNRFCEIAGYPREELLKLSDLDLAAPEEKERLRRIMDEISRTGVPPSELEYWIIRKDGTRRCIRNHYAASRKGDEIVGRYVTTTDITEHKQAEAERARLQQEITKAQKQAIQELSTPVIPIMERIIVMPLVGNIDSMRARDITRALLAGIRKHQARIVILDITGVSVVDSGVADHLNKTIQAARLKGAHTIVTGISDAVAETIVDLGIDWSGVETVSDLQTGLAVALDGLGIKLVR